MAAGDHNRAQIDRCFTCLAAMQIIVRTETGIVGQTKPRVIMLRCRCVQQRSTGGADVEKGKRGPAAAAYLRSVAPVMLSKRTPGEIESLPETHAVIGPARNSTFVVNGWDKVACG